MVQGLLTHAVVGPRLRGVEKWAEIVAPAKGGREGGWKSLPRDLGARWPLSFRNRLAPEACEFVTFGGSCQRKQGRA